MCGLVGYVTTQPRSYLKARKDFFTQGLFADTLRGSDSTGVALIQDNADPIIYKKPLAGPDFVDSRTWDRMSNRADPRVAIGHNRAATYGGISIETAHPFRHGNIILAHNGTLSNHRSLKDGNSFAVDSHYIAYSFAEFGVKETLKQIRGSFALTWYDMDTKLFHVARNDERTLFYVLNKKTETLMYASEADMLVWLATRNGLDVEDDLYYHFNEKVLYTIDPSTLEITEEEVEFAPKYQPRAGTQTGGTKTKNTQTGGANTVINLPIKYGGIMGPDKTLTDLGLARRESVELRFRGASDNGSGLLFAFAEYFPKETAQNATVVTYHRATYQEIVNNPNGLFEANVLTARYDALSNTYLVFVSAPTLVDGGDWEDLDTDPLGQDDDDEEPATCHGPAGQMIRASTFKALTEDGCVICAGPVWAYKSNKMAWTTDRDPICADCMEAHRIDNNPLISEYIEN